MKTMGIFFLVLVNLLFLFFITAPGLRLHTEAIYAREGVRKLKEWRLEADKGDITVAAACLKRVVDYWPTKLLHDGDLTEIYESSRDSVTREIIVILRSLSGVDLGDDPQKWIEKYYRKQTAPSNLQD